MPLRALIPVETQQRHLSNGTKGPGKLLYMTLSDLLIQGIFLFAVWLIAIRIYLKYMSAYIKRDVKRELILFYLQSSEEGTEESKIVQKNTEVMVKNVLPAVVGEAKKVFLATLNGWIGNQSQALTTAVEQLEEGAEEEATETIRGLDPKTALISILIKKKPELAEYLPYIQAFMNREDGGNNNRYGQGGGKVRTW